MHILHADTSIYWYKRYADYFRCCVVTRVLWGVHWCVPVLHFFLLQKHIVKAEQISASHIINSNITMIIEATIPITSDVFRSSGAEVSFPMEAEIWVLFTDNSFFSHFHKLFHCLVSIVADADTHCVVYYNIMCFSICCHYCRMV